MLLLDAGRYSTHDILYHGLKELTVEGETLYFITMVGRNTVFHQDSFFVLECKPSWSRSKVDMAWGAFTSAVTNASLESRGDDSQHDGGFGNGLAADSVAFEIPKFSKVHRVK